MTAALKMYSLRLSKRINFADFLSKVRTERGRRVVAFLILVVVTCLAFFPIFRGHTFVDVSSRQTLMYPWAFKEVDQRPTLHFDQADTFFPWQVFINNTLRAGEFPLWNPYSFGGQPFFANGQNGLLYPPKIILSLIFSPARVHDLLLFLHMLAGGIFMYMLLVESSLSFSASLFGAIAWMLNSFMLSWMALEHFVVIEAGLPLAILLLHRAIANSSWPASICSGVVLALIYLGGNLLFVEIVFAACGTWAAYLMFNQWWDRLRGRAQRMTAKQALRDASIVVVPFIICFGLIAVQLLPSLELVRSIERQPLSYADLIERRIDPFSLIYFFIEPVLEIVTSEGTGVDPYHRLIFLGTLTALLALIGVWQRHRLAAYARWVALFTVLVALGLPVTWVVYNVLPGFGHLKPLGRVLFMFDFAAAILAAFGLELLLARISKLARPPRCQMIKAACVFLITMSVVGQMYHFGKKVIRHQPNKSEYLYPETPLIRALRRDDTARILPIYPFFYGSTAMMFNLQSVGGYDSLVPDRISRLWRVVQGNTPQQAVSIATSYAFVAPFDMQHLRLEMLPRLGVTHLVALPHAALYSWSDKKRDPTGNVKFVYGQPEKGWIPLIGDWDGDGLDTIGLYDPVASEFHLRNSNTNGPDDVTFLFGMAGKGSIPIAGDWDGDGVDSVGLYEPGTGTFFLRNSNTSGPADLIIRYESAKSGWTPLAGDWDGDGIDTVALFDPVRSEFHMRNSNVSGGDDIVFRYGSERKGWIPIAGDWNGDGVDTVGLYEPATGVFWLRDWNTEGFANITVKYGQTGDGSRPLAGNFNRDSELLGLYDPTSSSFSLYVPPASDPLASNRVYHWKDGNIYKISGALPRAYFVPGCERVNSSFAALQRFTEVSFDPSRAVIVEEGYLPQTPVLCTPDGSAVVGGESDEVQITQRHLNSLTLRVNVARDGWLVVNESWDSGWKATVDGAPVPVIPGNYIFRTLPVSAGEHIVEMRYQPATFRTGLIISLSTLALVFGLSVGWMRKRFKS